MKHLKCIFINYMFILFIVSLAYGQENSSSSSNVSEKSGMYTFGGSSDDHGYSIIENSEGDYVIAGYTNSLRDRSSDIYLIKTDKNFNVLWERFYGGSSADRSSSLIESSDGGYVIGGTSIVNKNEARLSILKADSVYTVTGSTLLSGKGRDRKTDLYLIKTDKDGNVLWENPYGAYNDDGGQSIIESSDSGYVVAGFTRNKKKAYLIKTDQNGTLLWEQVFREDVGLSSYGPFGDKANSVIQTSDDGLLITGDFFSSAKRMDAYIIKMDSEGNVEWEQTYGGVDDDYGQSVIESSDGGYVITGKTSSSGAGNYDVFLVKLDQRGKIVWEQTYGGISADEGLSVIESSDGAYVITGSTKSKGEGIADVYLIKTDKSGVVIWERTYGGEEYDSGYSVIESSNGGYVIIGSTRSFGSGETDVFLINTDSEGYVK